MARQREDVRNLIHTPAELATNHLIDYKRRAAGGGVTFGIPAIDRFVIPMQPGDMSCIIARPGHGKTTLLARAAQHEADEINRRGTQESECVVYVTWETSAEELVNLFYAASDPAITGSDLSWGRTPVEQIEHKAAKFPVRKIFVIGHGIANAGKPTPRMTPEIVFEAIEAMQEDFGYRPVLMLFDYIQLIPIERNAKKVERVGEAANGIKRLAQRVGAPAMVGVQASRAVDARDDKTPEMGDAQWASDIEQVSDKIFGIWRPIITDNDKGRVIVRDGGENKGLQITSNLAILKMRKQRGDHGQHTWFMHFKPQSLELCEMEIRHTPPEYL